MQDKDQMGALVVDIDGTICKIKSENESYQDVLPRLDVIEKLRSYQSAGFRIVLFTARNMNTYKGNLGEIHKYTAPVLVEWLTKWDVPYDELLFGKPWPKQYGFYIDDRAIRPSEFLSMDDNEIKELLLKEKKEANK